MALRERKLGKFMILKILTGTTNNKSGCERRRDMIRLSKVPNFHSGFCKEDSCVPAALDARSAGQIVGVHFL